MLGRDGTIATNPETHPTQRVGHGIALLLDLAQIIINSKSPLSHAVTLKRSVPHHPATNNSDWNEVRVFVEH